MAPKIILLSWIAGVEKTLEPVAKLQRGLAAPVAEAPVAAAAASGDAASGATAGAALRAPLLPA